MKVATSPTQLGKLAREEEDIAKIVNIQYTLNADINYSFDSVIANTNSNLCYNYCLRVGAMAASTKRRQQRRSIRPTSSSTGESLTLRQRGRTEHAGSRGSTYSSLSGI